MMFDWFKRKLSNVPIGYKYRYNYKFDHYLQTLVSYMKYIKDPTVHETIGIDKIFTIQGEKYVTLYFRGLEYTLQVDDYPHNYLTHMWVMKNGDFQFALEQGRPSIETINKVYKWLQPRIDLYERKLDHIDDVVLSKKIYDSWFRFHNVRNDDVEKIISLIIDHRDKITNVKKSEYDIGFKINDQYFILWTSNYPYSYLSNLQVIDANTIDISQPLYDIMFWQRTKKVLFEVKNTRPSLRSVELFKLMIDNYYQPVYSSTYEVDMICQRIEKE